MNSRSTRHLVVAVLAGVVIVGVGARLVFRDKPKAVAKRFLADPMMKNPPTGYTATAKAAVEISRNPEETGPVGVTVSQTFSADRNIETLNQLVNPWTEAARAGDWTSPLDDIVAC